MRRAEESKNPNPYWEYVQKIENELQSNLIKPVHFSYSSGRLNPKNNSTDVRPAIAKIQTKVFIIGLLAACEFYNQENKLPDSEINEFKERLNSVTTEKWIFGFTFFWEQFIGSQLEPMGWPLFTSLILRVIQDNNKNELFATNPQASPDFTITEFHIRASIEGYRDSVLQGKDWKHLKMSDFPSPTMEKLFKEVYEDVGNFLSACQMSILDLDYNKIGLDYLDEKLKP
jgi:hypothetical protein